MPTGRATCLRGCWRASPWRASCGALPRPIGSGAPGGPPHPVGEHDSPPECKPCSPQTRRRYASRMTTAKSAARAATDSPVFRTIARIGYVVLGIVHIVIGAIAVSVATGGAGEADQGGAMEKIRDT